MKASHNTSQQKTTFASKPLTPEQLNAVDLLIQGKSDQETADLIGRDRVTIWTWKTRVPLFMATLEQRRQEVFGVAVNRLQSLLAKAIDNIAADIESGDIKSSFELVKATGLHGFCPPTGETDALKIANRICWEQLAKEQIPEKSFDLIGLDKNPRYEQRKAEILAELGGLGDELA
jgi:hypothetical protein